VKSRAWDDTLLAEHRAHIRDVSAGDAFDALVAAAIKMPGYETDPAWRGEVRIFKYVDPASGERPFAFIVNKSDLLFSVRPSGLRFVSGGFWELKRQFSTASVNPSGEWTVPIASKDDAERLNSFLFSEPTASQQQDVAGEDILSSSPFADESTQERAILDQADLSRTVKEALILARRGQGIFRDNVLRVEPRCRVTGIGDPNYLIASHIKPWSECSNEERLTENNGLMLAPHVDHLFDRGYISFTDNGNLLVSPRCAAGILTTWGISPTMNVGPFRTAQQEFLAYHRRHCLQS
jgi:HNH endonuclease